MGARDLFTVWFGSNIMVLTIDRSAGDGTVSAVAAGGDFSKMTIFMVTHDLQESFALGTRLLVFDKVRIDPQAPDAYGATITFNIPLKGRRAENPAPNPAQGDHITSIGVRV